MHPVDPPTWSFAFPTPVHFHLLRPLEPHPHPLPLHEKNKNHEPLKPLAQKKRIQISSPTLQIPKISAPSTTTSQKYLPHRRRQLLRENGRKNKK
jgi:hypothetical protein